MNKYIFVAFALFAVFISVRCEQVLEEVKPKYVKTLLTQSMEKFDEGLENLEETCPGVSPKLKAAVKSFIECDEKFDDSLTICESIQRHTFNCIRPLLQVIDDCLPQKAKGLPILGVKSLLSVADFMCKQTGESIFEQANPCLLEDSEETNENNECKHKINQFIENYEGKDDIPTRSEICTLATGFKSCVRRDVDGLCKNQKTRDVVNGLLDAVVAPCSNINTCNV
ncbi:hypothetical protein Zmor_024349 [Zophobas morio]|uniref:27 kDa hemolymph protein n=1 Tax=Zophobas morio TaxID=2755281 RepID=A0AA38M8N2_9CUCU|nr:hypothetical protein Zmor_024349 [Zophobas morio]